MHFNFDGLLDASQCCLALCLPSEVSESSMADAQLLPLESGGFHTCMGHGYRHARQRLP